MQLTDVLAQMGGLKSLATEVGVSEAQAASGASALLPAILGGLKKQAQSQGGTEGLGGLLGKLGGGGLLDNVLSPEPTETNRGNDVLGQIFGSKDTSRVVAQDAAAKSGLDPSLLKRMLPIVAMMVAGYMAKQRLGGGAGASTPAASGDTGGLGGLGGLGGMLGGVLGGGHGGHGGQGAAHGGLASMLDMDGDGNPLDDIMRMAGKFTR